MYGGDVRPYRLQTCHLSRHSASFGPFLARFLRHQDPQQPCQFRVHCIQVFADFGVFGEILSLNKSLDKCLAIHQTRRFPLTGTNRQGAFRACPSFSNSKPLLVSSRNLGFILREFGQEFLSFHHSGHFIHCGNFFPRPYLILECSPISNRREVAKDRALESEPDALVAVLGRLRGLPVQQRVPQLLRPSPLFS